PARSSASGAASASRTGSSTPCSAWPLASMARSTPPTSIIGFRSSRVRRASASQVVVLMNQTTPVRLRVSFRRRRSGSELALTASDTTARAARWRRSVPLPRRPDGGCVARRFRLEPLWNPPCEPELPLEKKGRGRGRERGRASPSVPGDRRQLTRSHAPASLLIDPHVKHPVFAADRLAGICPLQRDPAHGQNRISVDVYGL